MDTPITISSTSTEPDKSDFVQLNYSSKKFDETVISIDSSSYERVPVSWGPGKMNFTRTESNTTLTNIQKVSDWICSIKPIQEDDAKNDQTPIDLDQSSHFSGPKAEPMAPIKDDDTDSKSVILFRCDFNKTVTAKTYYPPPLNQFTRSAPVISYFNGDKGIQKSSECPIGSNEANEAASLDKKPIPKKTHRIGLKRSNSGKIIHYSNQINTAFSIEGKKESYCSKISDEKSEAGSDVYEVPLSPESRKKELCKYLQLMNPADKKERFILQNRRSTRVRNLAAMQEKKEMERKIRQAEVEDITQEDEKCATQKSFKELNISVEKLNFTSDLVEDAPPTTKADSDVDNFCFPFPSKDLTERIDNFDAIMAKLVPRYKRICKLKNIHFNCKARPILKNVENSVKTKNKEGIKPESMKNKLVSPKALRLKAVMRSRLRKPMTAERRKLRNPKVRNKVSVKRRNKKEVEKPQEVEKEQEAEKTNIESRETPRISPLGRISRNSRSKSRCEIVTVAEKSEDKVDLENFMDDVIDFNNLSEEHKKCLIQSRILSTKPISHKSTNNEKGHNLTFYSLDSTSPLYGFNKADENDLTKICEVYKNSSVPKDSNQPLLETVKEEVDIKTEKGADNCPLANLASGDNELAFDDDKFEIESFKDNSEHTLNKENGIPLQEHDYAGPPSEHDENEVDVVTVPKKNLPVGGYVQISQQKVVKVDKYELLPYKYEGLPYNKSKYEVLPYNKSVEVKSLHKSLQHSKKKTPNGLSDNSYAREWDGGSSPKQKSKKQTHYIVIDKENGPVLKAFYIDFNLIVCQEFVVSFWMQTPLGNVLGSQNMWIPRGSTQRLVLNSKCVQKESMEMVMAMEAQVAYIELWTKEHKSDIREGPVADVFTAVYYWRQGHNGLQRKVLQLENINGFADDVQYSVMKSAPKIIVSWHSANEDNDTRRTLIHAYQLAADYQTVAYIYDIEPVDHYVSSLHNIEDCDNLMMGCGENKITLWNLEYGYVVATIELTEIKSPLCTLWVKSDRGFLFALQQCVDRELRLIAINGINHSWKKLASYIPPDGFDRLRGVCIENGLLVSFYDQGILCWKAETGEPVEETNVETEVMPSGKYVILLEGNRIIVKHAITHLMSVSVEDS